MENESTPPQKENETESPQLVEEPTVVEKGRKFHVNVLTGNCAYAGTDADVYIELFGEENTSSGHLKLRNLLQNCFERGTKDEFKVSANGVKGNITKIVVGIKPPRLEAVMDLGSGWFLSSIEIFEKKRLEKKYHFLCNKWLDSHSEDALTERTLYPVAPEDIITFLIVEAKSLPALAETGFRSNPFAIVKYGTQTHQTNVAELTINPLFTGYPARFQREQNVFKFQVEIWNSGSVDNSTLKSTLIEKLEVNLTTFPVEEFWMDLSLKDESSEIIVERKKKTSWKFWKYMFGKKTEEKIIASPKKVNNRAKAASLDENLHSIVYDYVRSSVEDLPKKRKPVSSHATLPNPKITEMKGEQKDNRRVTKSLSSPTGNFREIANSGDRRRSLDASMELKIQEDKTVLTITRTQSEPIPPENPAVVPEAPMDEKQILKKAIPIAEKYQVDFGAPAVHFRIYNGAGFDIPGCDYCLMTLSPATLGSIRSGDVIAFSGRSLLAKVIKFSTDSPYSHVGIAVRMPDPFTKEEELFIIESTQNPWHIPDYIEKVPRKGATIFKLEDRLKNIDCSCAWHFPLNFPLNSKEKTELINVVMKLHDGKVRYDKKQLLEFSLPYWENKEDVKELFCSELVALCLRTVGRMPENANPSALTPADVVHGDCFSSRGPGVRINLLRFEVEKSPITLI